jgi:cellulose synthase/poly-beta-1,6-N-acetylglucosamine synthase-like glycosyltransferase
VIEFLQLLQIICIAVSCLFVLSLMVGLRTKSHYRSRQDLKVSVLVAARDEERTLPGLLADLTAQDYPRELVEFIIIDDASMDGTGEIVAEWVQKDDRFGLLRLEDASVTGMGPKKRALLQGIKASRGDVIMVTDADCRVSTKWISSTVECFDEETAAVCGRVRFQKTATIWGRLAAFEGFTNTVLNAGVIGIGGALSCGGANFAYRRSAFEKAGGFDTGKGSFSGDDDLLLQRIRKAGVRVCFNGDSSAAVITDGPGNRGEYLARKRRHLSAGKRYAAHWILLASIVYTGCLLTVLFTILNISGWNFVMNPFKFWILLSVFIFTFLAYGARLFKQTGMVVWNLLAALIFPLVFVAVHPMTLLPSPAWKGRHVKRTD